MVPTWQSANIQHVGVAGPGSDLLAYKSVLSNMIRLSRRAIAMRFDPAVAPV